MRSSPSLSHSCSAIRLRFVDGDALLFLATADHSGQEGLAITATDSRLVVQHELTGFQVLSNVLSNALSGALLNVPSNIPSDVPSNALSNDLSNDLSNVLVNCFIECMAY